MAINERAYSTQEVSMSAMPSGQKIAPLTDINSFRAFHADGVQWIIALNEATSNNPDGSFIYRLVEDDGTITSSSKVAYTFDSHAIANGSTSTHVTSDRLSITNGISTKPEDRPMVTGLKVQLLTCYSNMSTRLAEVDLTERMLQASADVLDHTYPTSIGYFRYDSGTAHDFNLLVSVRGVTPNVENKTMRFKVNVSEAGTILSITHIGTVETVLGNVFGTLGGRHFIDITEKPGEPVTTKIIDVNTLAVKGTWEVPWGGLYTNAYIDRSMPIDARRTLHTSFDRSLYGPRIAAAVSVTYNDPDSKSLYTAVWVEQSGGYLNRVVLTEPHVEMILGVDSSGAVYYLTQDTSEVASMKLHKQDSYGSLALTATYDDWVKAGWSYEWTLFLFSQTYRGSVRLDTNGQLSMRYEGFQSDSAYMSLVIDKHTCLPAFGSRLYATIPKVGSYAAYGITSFDQYDAITDSVTQRQIVINTRHSTGTNPPNVTADKFRYAQYPIKYVSKFIIKLSNTGEAIGWGGPKIDAKVDGEFAYAEFDSNTKTWHLDVNGEGANIDLVITLRGYKPKKYSYVFNPNVIPVIILDQLDWIRKSYEIYTPQDLYDVREDPVGNYTIMNDIDMQGFTWDPMFTSSDDPFMGSVDGQGFTIRNFRYLENSNSSVVSNYASIFGKTMNATFKNINIDSSEVTAQSGTGVAVLVASAEYTEIYYENQPPGYEKQFPRFENINAKNCRVSSMYGASYHAIICGEFAVNYPYDSTEEPFVDCSAIDCEIQGLEYGGSYYTFGGILGHANISAPAQ